jgi:hypothetical protein
MNRFKLTVFVGDIYESLAVIAKTYDPTATLVDMSNYKLFLTSDLSRDTTIYTALADLPKDHEAFHVILNMATDVVYTPPEVWSDGLTVSVADPYKSLQGKTENILLRVSRHKNVKNIHLCYFVPTAIPLADTRKTTNPQIWCVGPSITHGSGIDTNQRYGQLVADELKMACSFLTRPKSSIRWGAEQILRSDLRCGDLVIWGLAGTERLELIQHGHHEFITAMDYKLNPNLKKILPPENLCGETNFYSQLYSIEQVINYCNNLKVKLFILGLTVSPNMLRYLKNKKNYFDFPYQLHHLEPNELPSFVDLGTDNVHPGPEQHKLYKNFIIEKLKTF